MRNYIIDGNYTLYPYHFFVLFHMKQGHIYRASLIISSNGGTWVDIEVHSNEGV